MKLQWKTCFRICASLFLLYLCIFYWEGVSKFFGTFLKALSPLLLGLVIAYVLNILMSWYERHYFRKRPKLRCGNAHYRMSPVPLQPE